jgi:hypothetical protein
VNWENLLLHISVCTNLGKIEKLERRGCLSLEGEDIKEKGVRFS